MPVLVARKGGPCAACGAPILEGERITYTLETGARHLACEDRVPELRRNRYAARCALCGFLLRKGRGRLDVTETCEGGAFSRVWRVSCVDAAACHARLARAPQ
ncbi:hypothetical protein LXT21_19435 [Myxococcus sp. K38C18041901]|uniref:hypothetical protein n=1 Tax=Myxococcus guangdongensis TaxID=2906760 RepID=UPI0020A72F27|nr:hypothetical protein [Myxococcus guangdongensis]MCP3060962.1 hypothetical protein [Myxococcus guangdongensis]